MIEVHKGKNFKDLGLIPITTILPKEELGPGEFDINKEQYVRDKLKEDPDFECWDFLKYSSYKQGFCICTTHVLVSNTGKIAVELTDGTHINSGTLSGKYLQAHIDPTLTNEYINIYLHRAVACTYLAIPEKYKELGEGKLEVNHLDGVKTNPHFLNLEWGTKSDNLKHAVKYGLIKTGIDNVKVKPVLGTVVVDGKWKGTQFVLIGRTAISNLGLDPASIQQTVSGKAKATYGCSWVYIDKEEVDQYPKEIPEELLNRMINDKVSLLLTTKPVMAWLEKDGMIHSCVFMGTKEILEAGFQQAHVSRVCSGVLKSHGGLKWKQISLREAETLHRGLTKELKEILNR